MVDDPKLDVVGAVLLGEVFDMRRVPGLLGAQDIGDEIRIRIAKARAFHLLEKTVGRDDLPLAPAPLR